ncbi:PAS domain S-box protein [Daejeonella sp.]|jgi:PAS domain S-box-containing protein|uniref:PAS domain-containing sensor histidine kinase n=1 Tax=Daejeonella sp. TaxID=2805397 RepID=UPI0037843C7D
MNEKSALLYAIIENAIDGIITISDRGLIESINPAACALFGYSHNEVIGKNISILMPKPDKDQHDQYISRYQETGAAKIIGKGRDVNGQKKDGTLFPFRLGVNKVNFSGRTIYAGFIHDLSKEKEAEAKILHYASQLEKLVEDRTLSLQKSVTELEAAKEIVSKSLVKEKELNQLKSRFVSMASHEFRTPLSSITLSASLIEKYKLQSDDLNVSKHVTKIKSSVANLTTILDDFLSLERLEAGKIETNLTHFDIVKLSEEITEEMQLMAKKDQNIIYQHTGTHSMVLLDQNLLRNCIVNLISNAIKYSGENTFIEFNTELADNVCIVNVCDNGIGIPEIDHKHLFEPFFRANNTGNIPGTGLGLNIITRYVKLMGGKVNFSSLVNQKTVFTLNFPQ